MIEYNSVLANRIVNDTNIDNKLASQVLAVASNERTMKKFFDEFRRLKKEMQEESERNKKDGVYLLNITGYKQDVEGGYDA